jgi:cell shape-determining protein MreC
MKTTSLKRSKKPNGPAQGRVTIICFVCVILILIQWLFPSVLFRILYVVSTPFTILRDGVGGEFSSVSAFMSSKESLANQNTNLEKDLSAINVKLLSMQALESENQALKNIIATKQVSVLPSKNIFAAVTEGPPFSPYDSLIISSGLAAGITLGNPVFSDNGTTIGTVEEVFPSSAKILLFSSPGTSLAVTVGEKNFETIAEGKGGGDFSMKIPVTNEPQVGDAVYISEFAPTPLGEVESVSAGPTDAFATVLFSYPENIFEIPFVTVDTSRHFDITTITNEATTTSQ